MILVDTSVLILYLNEVEQSCTTQFQEIQDGRIPFGINDYIYQEMLQGCRSEKDFRLLKKYLDSQTFFQLKKGRESFAEAAMMYMQLRKKGITVRSTIDCIIAQMAIENDLYLLHHDTDFTRIAQVFPLKLWKG